MRSLTFEWSGVRHHNTSQYYAIIILIIVFVESYDTENQEWCLGSVDMLWTFPSFIQLPLLQVEVEVVFIFFWKSWIYSLKIQ